MYGIYIIFLLLLTVKRDDDVLGIIFLKPGLASGRTAGLNGHLYYA